MHQYYRGYPRKGDQMTFKEILKKVALVLWPVIVTVVNGYLGIF